MTNEQTQLLREARAQLRELGAALFVAASRRGRKKTDPIVAKANRMILRLNESINEADAALEAGDGWVVVSERLPEMDVNVDVAYPFTTGRGKGAKTTIEVGVARLCAVTKRGGKEYLQWEENCDAYHDDYIEIHPTHWRRRPLPPKPTT